VPRRIARALAMLKGNVADVLRRNPIV